MKPYRVWYKDGNNKLVYFQTNAESGTEAIRIFNREGAMPGSGGIKKVNYFDGKHWCLSNTI